LFENHFCAVHELSGASYFIVEPAIQPGGANLLAGKSTIKRVYLAIVDSITTKHMRSIPHELSKRKRKITGKREVSNENHN